jgi:hypothetical protein
MQRRMAVPTAAPFATAANKEKESIMARGKNLHVVKHDEGCWR